MTMFSTSCFLFRESIERLMNAGARQDAAKGETNLRPVAKGKGRSKINAKATPYRHKATGGFDPWQEKK